VPSGNNGKRDSFRSSIKTPNGAAFCAEFIETVINTMRQLFADGTIAGAFGRDIPAIIHELEYYAAPNSWTKHANPKGLANEFLAWANSV